MLKRTIFLLPAVLLTFFSCVTQPSVRSGSMPAWVNDVYSVYSHSVYVAATGFGATRAAAEGNAIAALTSFFGQSIQIDRTYVSSYMQAITDGVMDGWVDTAEMRTNIRTTSSMENLIGVEIKEIWFDSIDTYYAVAVMERVKTARVYNELILANKNVINNLLLMTAEDKSSLEGALRYRFAAVVSDINVSYKNIVLLLTSAAPDVNADGDSYRLAAQDIIKTIPIYINVTNDRNDRIFGAFARCFANWGFETSSVRSRYALNVNVSVTPLDFPETTNVFLRIEVSADLRDTSSGVVLVPFNFNSREGHVNQTEAENRCFNAAERSINEDFAGRLNVYLSQLMPKK